MERFLFELIMTKRATCGKIEKKTEDFVIRQQDWHKLFGLISLK